MRECTEPLFIDESVHKAITPNDNDRQMKTILTGNKAREAKDDKDKFGHIHLVTKGIRRKIIDILQLADFETTNPDEQKTRGTHLDSRKYL